MRAIKNAFQYLSYLQYPIVLIALYFAYKPLIFGMEMVWSDLNNTLIFMGLAVSFSTLQDTTKVQNKLSKRVWENSKYATIFLIYLGVITLVVLGFGFYGYFFSEHPNIQEIALGAIIFGISLIGFLKMGIEMAEHHGNKPMNEN